MDWRTYYGRLFQRALGHWLDRADLWASIVGLGLATAVHFAPQLGGRPQMPGFEIFGYVALFILGARLALTPYWLANAEAKEKAVLVERLRARLSLRFEPSEPWRRRVEKAQIPHGLRTFVAPALFFRIEVVAETEAVAHGCRVWFRSLERCSNPYAYESTIYDGSSQLRWAQDVETPFAPRTVSGASRQYIDVLSVDGVHNRVIIKWPQDWLAHDALFDAPSIYRLTIASTSDDAGLSQIVLFLVWTGKWEQTQVYPEGYMSENEIHERFNRLMEAMATKPPLSTPSGTLEEACPASDARPTHVVTILKLPKVLLKVLTRDVNVRPVDAAFQVRPVAFDRIGMDVAAHILAFAVVDRL